MMGAEQSMASAARRHSVWKVGTREDTGRRMRTTCVDVDSNNRKRPSNELKQQHHLLTTIGTTPQGNIPYLILRGDKYGKDRKTEYLINLMCSQSQQP